MIPPLRAYDPAFAYELATIVRDGIERMHGRGEDVFYYITLYNENYPQPAKPDGVDEAIVRGLYRFLDGPGGRGRREGPRPPRRVRHDPPAGDRGPRPPRRAVRRRRRGLQRHLLPAAPPRRARGRALEPAPPDRGAARAVRRRGARRRRRPRHRWSSDWVKALPDLLGRWLPAGYVAARDRRLRPQRHSRGTAGALRDRRRRTSPSPRSRHSGRPARSRPRRSPRRSKTLGIDPDKLDPLDL